MPQLYLASKSPRRREILAILGITDIELLVAGPMTPGAFAGDEEQLPDEDPADYVIRMAREKALQAIATIQAQGLPPAPVLAADTVVIFDGEVLGKPVDADQARLFLSRLSGNTHQVRTAVAVGSTPEDLQVAVSVSNVHFTRLEPELMAEYIATGEPFDKAGGYGIQGLAGLFIDRIEGSYTGIMGLPVFETGRLLRNYGLLRLGCGKSSAH